MPVSSPPRTVWTLNVVDKTGTGFAIYGTQEVLELAYEELKKTSRGADIDSHAVVEVFGFADEELTKEARLWVRVNTLQGAFLNQQ